MLAGHAVDKTGGTGQFPQRMNHHVSLVTGGQTRAWADEADGAHAEGTGTTNIPNSVVADAEALFRRQIERAKDRTKCSGAGFAPDGMLFGVDDVIDQRREPKRRDLAELHGRQAVCEDAQSPALTPQRAEGVGHAAVELNGRHVPPEYIKHRRHKFA